MRLKFLFLTAIISFSCQIAFSIYYSLKIVDENILINKNQVIYSSILIQNQNLENSLSDIDSIQKILNISQNKTLQPISNTIDLNQ
jgi:hypothetical protein